MARAAALFAERGFLGASVQDIAKACGTSKSLLYHYYPSKEDVLYAVMASHIEHLVEDVEAIEQASGTAAERLLDLIKRFMAHYVGAAARQKVLLNDLEYLPADKRAVIVAQQRKVMDAVQQLVVAVDPALADDPAAARVKTMLLFGMINWTGNWYNPEGPVKTAQLAEMAFAMLKREG